MFRRRTKKIERLDFLIAGTQKGGTSALHYHLDQHPQITMAHSEEAHLVDHPRRHFFDDETRFSSGEVSYDILHEDVRVKPGSRIIGSCTPIYTYWRPAMKRIHDYHPGIKLIILLRNPADRAFSHWNMYRDRKQEDLGFLEAIREEKNRLRAVLPLQQRRHSYLDRGFYFEQIERVFQFFPQEQVRVIKFEEFRRRTEEMVNDVFRFLGVEPLATVRNREQNRIRYDRRMTPEERQFLVDTYRPDVSRLEELLGWDCSDWKQVGRASVSKSLVT
jgi:hypothetical protein